MAASDQPLAAITIAVAVAVAAAVALPVIPAALQPPAAQDPLEERHRNLKETQVVAHPVAHPPAARLAAMQQEPKRLRTKRLHTKNLRMKRLYTQSLKS